MKNKSAGLLMYRFNNAKLEVLIAHMGGPFWAKKDVGAWSIPKGEFEPSEDPLDAAKREFYEETNIIPTGDFIELSPIIQSSGKQIYAWAFKGNCDTKLIKSNTFKMEWPPRSGKMGEFPEIDKAEWFDTSVGKDKILKGQRGFIDELISKLNYNPLIEKTVDSKKIIESSNKKTQQTLFDL